MTSTTFRIALANALVASTALVVAATSHAAPLPPSTFRYAVIEGFSPECSTALQSVAGTCGTFGVGSYANADGGIPDTNVGTSVTAAATGRNELSIASMTYYFTIGGPAGQEVPVDIISAGSASTTGSFDGAYASLAVFDTGHNPASGSEFRSVLSDTWNQGTDWNTEDVLCLQSGDTYEIRINADALTGRAGGTASAALDPHIKIDPPGQAPFSGVTVINPGPGNCGGSTFDPAPYSLTVSSGSSTGFAVPEPATLALFGVGLLAMGASRRHFKRAARSLPR